MTRVSLLRFSLLLPIVCLVTNLGFVFPSKQDNSEGSERLENQQTGPNRGYLIFSVTGDTDFLITDPLGRQKGIDPDTGGSVFGIPSATFGSDSVGDDDPQNGGFPTNPSIRFETDEPVEGLYQIALRGLSGTEFHLGIVSYATAGGLNNIRDEVGTIEAGEVVIFTYNYSGDPAVEGNLDVSTVSLWDAKFEVNGSLTLGEASNGIDLLTESVTLSIDTLHRTTTPGSFAFNTGIFRFSGEINRVKLDITFTPVGDNSFEFKAVGEGANLKRIVNPVDVQLTIGDDFARTSVNADL